LTEFFDVLVMPKRSSKSEEGMLRWRAQTESVHDSDIRSESSHSGDDADASEVDSQLYSWKRGGWTDVLKATDYDDGCISTGYFLLVQTGGAVLEESSPGFASCAFPAFCSAISPPFRAKIMPFFEGSFYSSLQGIKDDNSVWEGDDRELMYIAEHMLDPKMRARQLCKDDFDFEIWDAMYKGVVAWRDNGFPLWRGRQGVSILRGAAYWNRVKTPEAKEVAAAWTRMNDAATVISAAFRGWIWRLRVLYNPHTEVGRSYMTSLFDK
jgi:hypothetical protein